MEGLGEKITRKFIILITLVMIGSYVSAKDYEHYVWYKDGITLEIYSPPNERISDTATELFFQAKNMEQKPNHSLLSVTYIYNKANILSYIVTKGLHKDAVKEYNFACYASVYDKASGTISYKYYDRCYTSSETYYLTNKLLAQVYPVTKQKYKVGDRGPGGGIVFCVAGNIAYEVSAKLGISNIDGAVDLCDMFHGQGFDWELPTQSQLEDIYTNLVKKGFLDIYRNNYVWSTSCTEQDKALFIDFTDGKWYSFKDEVTGICSVFAVRFFEFDD